MGIDLEKTNPNSSLVLRSGNLKIRAARRRRLEQFQEPYRKFIRILINGSDRAEDLVDTFPGLLFALATSYGTPEQRERCFERVEAGESLKQAAAELGIPWWMRKVPAAAFTGPLGELPKSKTFARRISNDIPQRPRDAIEWFSRVVYAYRAGSEDYALWISRQSKFPFRRLAGDPFTLLAAWAWYSGQPDTLGYRLLRKPWEPRLSLKRSYDEARAWERRLDLAVCLGAGVNDTWFVAGDANGYEFKPLKTIEDFLTEATAMDNCLDQYADQVSIGTARIFTIRRNNRHVANVEVAPHEDDATMPAIEQLRGPRNIRATAEIWQAAYAWLGQQKFRALKPSCKQSAKRGRAEVWDNIWGPYLQVLKGKPEFKRAQRFAKQAHTHNLVSRPADRELLEL